MANRSPYLRCISPWAPEVCVHNERAKILACTALEDCCILIFHSVYSWQEPHSSRCYMASITCTGSSAIVSRVVDDVRTDEWGTSVSPPFCCIGSPELAETLPLASANLNAIQPGRTTGLHAAHDGMQHEFRQGSVRFGVIRHPRSAPVSHFVSIRLTFPRLTLPSIHVFPHTSQATGDHGGVSCRRTPQPVSVHARSGLVLPQHTGLDGSESSTRDDSAARARDHGRAGLEYGYYRTCAPKAGLWCASIIST
jgi:hypothetical protein